MRAAGVFSMLMPGGNARRSRGRVKVDTRGGASLRVAPRASRSGQCFQTWPILLQSAQQMLLAVGEEDIVMCV
jgi:hypothetical protein